MANFKKLVEGEVLSESQFYKVIKVKGDEVQIQNTSGENVVVNSKYVENCLTSANQFTTEKTINKTEAANILLSNPNTAMTVSFNKQVKPADVKKAMKELYPNSGKIVAKKDYDKSVDTILKGALEGEERIIVGFFQTAEVNEFGRVNFIDMNLVKDPSSSYDSRIRQVDTRNINFIIVKGTKYVVK